MRNLILILGDQLNTDASAFDEFDPAQDLIWMAEVREESIHVWSSKQRIAVFLAAMRHFKSRVEAMGWPILYRRLDSPNNRGTLALELNEAINQLKPRRLIMTAPGEWRVLRDIKRVAKAYDLAVEVRDDRTFFSTVRDFSKFAESRRQLRMEFWYRFLRKRHGILMEGNQPTGGRWNFDSDNRKNFGSHGPEPHERPLMFNPDEITKGVIALVEEHFQEHPGSLSHFGWPTTPEDAKSALNDFIEHRLGRFGPYEDAMWQGEPWLFHSQLSVAMNLKLISAQEVVSSVEKKFFEGGVSLSSAEGFIRQVIGWREYVRGIYWTQMPAYVGHNALDAHHRLPSFFWNADTSMQCLRECLGQTLALGYAHHIQRLMVIGLYALLFGVRPQEVHEWFLAVYVDAVEWVELPNTLGMGQFADGGYMSSKPYVASGMYIRRMSNYCQSCCYEPDQSTGEKACPFTTLYWDFLLRHRDRLKSNNRMSLQLRNLDRIGPDVLQKIAALAKNHRQSVMSAEGYET